MVLARVVLAWLPLAGLWTLIILSVEGATLVSAARFGFISIGTAAILSYGVWHLTGRYEWPDHVSAGFYLAHAGFAALFAVSWMVIGMTANSLVTGLPIFRWHLSVSFTFWRFLMGLFLYGLIAGVSYSMRTRVQLRQQETATLEAQALAAEAKLESLRAQLNPHFLFNALHSVSELMHTDVAGAERSIEDLAGLLRYSLGADSEDIVSLAQEWEFVEGYLSLERLRLGQRLRFESHLDQEALAARIPSFTVQVLVENSIRHAIAPRPEGGRIRVSAKIEDEVLQIEVEDDGPGFEARADSPTPSSSDGDSGRGLPLLRQRLDAIYALAGDLDIDSQPGRGTTATVRVPQPRHRRDHRST